ncbi:uncharacterized protein DDB_G0280579-like [Ambystoma mexicanum]|uniref:uncharacterized protein DDB_G0280579-like n=1 Tax=Ambystoma mexicanum TaxID=8296 RepID=UPI0037E7597A
MVDRPEQVYTAQERLLDFQQGTQDMLTYVTRFKQLAKEADWSSEASSTMFRRGLNDEIKDDLARVAQPNSFHALMDLAMQIDFRIQERKAEKKKSKGNPTKMSFESTVKTDNNPSSASESEPMQIGAFRGLISPQERMRRIHTGLYESVQKKGTDRKSRTELERKESAKVESKSKAENKKAERAAESQSEVESEKAESTVESKNKAKSIKGESTDKNQKAEKAKSLAESRRKAESKKSTLDRKGSKRLVGEKSERKWKEAQMCEWPIMREGHKKR